MRHKTLVSILAVATLFFLTMGFGYAGWVVELCVERGEPQPQCRWDAVYGALLALTGSDYYLNAENDLLHYARFLGFFTTIVTLIVLVLVFVAERIRKLRINLRRNHIVLVGISDFALSYCEVLASRKNCGITVIDSREALEERGERLLARGILMIAADLSDMSKINWSFGLKPGFVVFGARASFTNIERFLTSNIRRGAPQVFVRVEDESMACDLSLWSKRLANASILSEGKMVASGLITKIMPTRIAVERGQERVHVAVIGIGSMGLSLIEEIALRCHHLDLKRAIVSAFDIDSAQQFNRIKLNRPGLLNALDLEGPIQLDGRACGLTGDDDPLVCVEKQTPLTCIVVATGSDETNAAIAMRLRRIQHRTDILKAPIFVRIKASLSISPAGPVELNGGISVFGGINISANDIALETLRETQAKELHDIWMREVSAGGTAKAKPWHDLGVSQKRASRRAAFSVIELLYSVGLEPPEQGDLAGLRADPAAIDATLANPDLMARLGETEHNRWIAERASEGWTQSPTGTRDDSKLLHTSMKPYQHLTEAERKKDINNVVAILEECKKRAEKSPRLSQWRRTKIGANASLS